MDALAVLAILGNGILAGLFFAFACAVSPAARQLEDREMVHTFQAVNRAILRGPFLPVFLSAPLFSLAAAGLALAGPGQAAAFLHVLGASGSLLTLALTVVVNVPRNQELEAAEITSPQQLQAARRRFETPWDRSNRVRTLTSILAFAAPALTLLL